MYKVSDIFEMLQHGELTQLAIGGVDGNGIQESDYPAVLTHMNMALTELYKRFPLKIDEVIVQQEDHIQTYYLEYKYAETNTASTEPYKYIKDSVYQPFKNNVLRIERIFNEDGQELYINDDQQYWSVHTPSFNSIQVPYPEKENAMVVEFRANHDKLVADCDPQVVLDQDVRISSSHLEAFLLYIAHRVYAANPSLNPSGADGTNYYGKFEASCLKISELNLINKDNRSNHKLRSRGWV